MKYDTYFYILNVAIRLFVQKHRLTNFIFTAFKYFVTFKISLKNFQNVELGNIFQEKKSQNCNTCKI